MSNVSLTNIDGVDPTAKEITLDSNGLSENTYRPNFPVLSEPVLPLFNMAIEHSPEILASPWPELKNWELIGLTRKNNTNYPEDTISISYRRCDVAQVAPLFDCELPEGFVQGTSYTLKLQLETQQKALKVYDLNIARHQYPRLPPGCVPIDYFGVGLHLNDERLLRFRDIYFYTDLTGKEIGTFFNVAPPNDGDTTRKKRAFGCLFDASTLEVIKIKQYLLPGDPTFKNP